jgi:hypothetical protein
MIDDDQSSLFSPSGLGYGEIFRLSPNTLLFPIRLFFLKTVLQTIHAMIVDLRWVNVLSGKSSKLTLQKIGENFEAGKRQTKWTTP